MANFVFKRATRRFRRRVENVAAHVHFPAVVNAAQAALFVAAEEKRRAAVRTVLVEQTDPALAVAKGDEVFTEQAHADRRAVWLGNFL